MSGPGAAEVLPGIWRLALDLPWPGAEPVNAWALATADGGVVVVDTGMSCTGSFEQLTGALAAAGFTLEDVRRVVCTHAHADHAGQAAPLAQAAGCELWMHAEHRHGIAPLADRDAEVARRVATARRCGLPADALAAYAAAIRAQDLGFEGIPRPDRVLRDGVEIETSGTWRVVETPGHAPSHVCLHEPEAGLLICGDHLLERQSLGFDHGFTPDPVGELLHSLERVEELDVRLCLPGHGDPFDDARGAIAATRAAVAGRIGAVRAALAGGDARTPFEVASIAYAPTAGHEQAGWMFAETLCVLEHLELRGEVRLAGPLRWQQP